MNAAKWQATVVVRTALRRGTGSPSSGLAIPNDVVCAARPDRPLTADERESLSHTAISASGCGSSRLSAVSATPELAPTWRVQGEFCGEREDQGHMRDLHIVDCYFSVGLGIS